MTRGERSGKRLGERGEQERKMGWGEGKRGQKEGKRNIEDWKGQICNGSEGKRKTMETKECLLVLQWRAAHRVHTNSRRA